MAKFNSMRFRIVDEDIYKEAASSKHYFRFMTDGELELFKSGKVVKRGDSPYLGGTTGPADAIFFLGVKTKCWDPENPEIVRYLSPSEMYSCLTGIVSEDNLVEFETTKKPGKAIGTYSNIIDGWNNKKDIYPKFGKEYDSALDMKAEEYYFTSYSKKDFKIVKVWSKPYKYDSIKIKEAIYKEDKKCYNKSMLTENEKELYSGIFWIKDKDDPESSNNLCFTLPTNISGEVIGKTNFNLNAKSGNTYNHENLWKTLPRSITEGKPFNYYPRGRVQISNGKATVYYNPILDTEEVKKFIIDTFNLKDYFGIKKVKFIPDFSEHYKSLKYNNWGDTLNFKIIDEDYIESIKEITGTYADCNEDINYLARSIAKDFKRTGKIDFRGTEINSAKDLAQLFAIYRDPRYETQRVVFVKDNKIVSVQGVSSRIPARSTYIRRSSKDRKLVDERTKMFIDYKHLMERTTADGYYLFHNHPSGDVEFSNEDYAVDEVFKNNLNGYIGSIVIGDDKANILDSNGTGTIVSITADNLTTKSDVLGTTFNKDNIVRNYLLVDSAMLVFLDVRNRITALADIDKKDFNNSEIYNRVDNEARNNGADRVVVITDDKELFQTKLIMQVKIGNLTDAIYYDREANRAYSSYSKDSLVAQATRLWDKADRQRYNEQYLNYLNNVYYIEETNNTLNFKLVEDVNETALISNLRDVGFNNYFEPVVEIEDKWDVGEDIVAEYWDRDEDGTEVNVAHLAVRVYHETNRKGICFREIWVSKDYQGQGIAAQLVEACLLAIDKDKDIVLVHLDFSGGFWSHMKKEFPDYNWDKTIKDESLSTGLSFRLVEDLSDKEILEYLDEICGQEKPYAWSTYILPNGHFLSHDVLDSKVDYELDYEHSDYYELCDDAARILDDYCCKVNVTWPYISMPNETRPTVEQFNALKELVNNYGSELYNNSGDIQDIKNWNIAGSEHVEDMQQPLIIYSKNGDAVYDLAINSIEDIIKKINKSYSTGILEEKIIKKGSKWQVQSETGKNLGIYDTKEEAKKRLQQIEYFKYKNESLKRAL